MLTPNDVFTPGRLPLAATNVYASRGRCEDDFALALRRGFVPIVFGEFGVGKTSLARHHLLELESERRLVYVESVAGKNLADVLKVCLEHVGYRIVSRVREDRRSGRASGVGAEFGVEFPGFKAALRGDHERTGETGTEVEHELVVTSPTDSNVLSICENHGLVLLLDELHKASREFAEALTQFLKGYANRSATNFRIALVGTASDAARLVDLDPGIDRLVQEVHLRAMTDEEARFLVTTGMHQLQIDLTEDVLTRIIRSGVGSPSLIQYLCLEIAETAFERDSRTTEVADFTVALRTYVERRSQRLHALYAKAIETVGPRRYRKQILRAMAEIEDEYATMEQIRDKVSDQVGEAIDSTALSGPLRQLKTEEFGPVLKDVERHEGGERVFNYTTFVDPAMKSFIRMYNAGEDEGVFQG